MTGYMTGEIRTERQEKRVSRFQGKERKRGVKAKYRKGERPTKI
jgi:hypothetical protein